MQTHAARMTVPVPTTAVLFSLFVAATTRCCSAAAWTTANSKPAASLLLRRRTHTTTTMALHAVSDPSAAARAERDDAGQLIIPSDFASPLSDMPLHPVMVYGSLLSGLNNHHVMVQHRATYLRAGRTLQPFYLTGLRSLLYPYLSPFPLVAPDQPATQIFGEVYAVTSKALRALDDFEGDEYVRTEVAVELLPAVAGGAGETGAGSSGSSGSSGDESRRHLIVYMYMLPAPDKVAPERPDLGSSGGELDVVTGGCWRSHVAERRKRG